MSGSKQTPAAGQPRRLYVVLSAGAFAGLVEAASYPEALDRAARGFGPGAIVSPRPTNEWIGLPIWPGTRPEDAAEQYRRVRGTFPN